MLPNNQSAKALYEQLATSRDPFLRRARSCALLTLPYVMPPEGAAGSKDYDTPFQSVGARGVVNLAAKLLLALLPPNTPFFKLAIDQFELKKIEQDKKLKTELDSALGEMEQAVLVELETSASRVTAFEAMQHLVITGNSLLEIPGDGNLKVYRLDRYVVQRDPMGHVLSIVIKEQVAPSVLPEETQAALGKASKEKTVELYTVCLRTPKGSWEVWQEVKDKLLEDSEGTYPEGECPFVPLRFNKVDGEDYGRGFVEQYEGDLNSLETLSRALVEGGVAASKILFLVAPNGLTNAAKLAAADNGDFVPGQEADVHCLQINKQSDFQFVYNQAATIEKRLEMAFLLMSSIQRNAERVTAEEIRSLVTELEASLGGVYSVLAQDFQLPLASALMARMSKDKRLPKLPKKVVRPTVTTGLEALGRGNDLQKLDAFINGIAERFGPEAVVRYVQLGEYLARRATALGVSTKGLIRTDEEVTAADAQAQQSAQMQSVTEKLGPEAMRQLGAANATAK